MNTVIHKKARNDRKIVSNKLKKITTVDLPHSRRRQVLIKFISCA